MGRVEAFASKQKILPAIFDSFGMGLGYTWVLVGIAAVRELLGNGTFAGLHTITMNLNDFNKTDYSGLYISKESHPTFGKKYIARFQHNKKRYVKVLGYTKKDNLSKKVAVSM